MANRINYQIGFDVKQNTLNQLKTSLQQLRKIMPSDIIKINDSDVADANRKFLEIEKQAQNVEEAIKQAFNAKLNTVNIDTFNQSLKNSGSSIEQVYSAFKEAGAVGENAFRSLSSHVLSTNIQLKESHTLLDKMATTLANSAKWSISSGIINNMSRSIQQAWGYTKALDSSLNDIRIVTGKSADEMANFAVQANNVAKELGKTTTDYTNAALIYAQQGLNDKEVAERAAITLKAANVTGQSTDAVSEQLTAVWNGYKVTADQAELYVDRLAAVAATTASDLKELSTGMSKVASAAAAMGVGQDQLAAQLSTIISVTKQAPESVGTALRTVYARISDIKAGIDEDGVTLGRYSGQMEALGFHVLDATGNLRDMGEVMEEIGGRWQDLTREQQISLAQTMAGQRQYSNLIALFDNFEEYNRALNTAQNAAGTLQEQQDIYMESTDAHLNTLKASVENIYDSLADTDSINGLIDGLAAAADLVANFVDSIGGGGAALRSLGAIGITVFSQQIAKGLNTTITNLEVGRENARQFDQALQATKDWQGIPELTQVSRDLLNNRQQLLELSKLMTPTQFSGLQTLLNNMIESGNQVEALEKKIAPLQKVIDLFSNKKFQETMGDGKTQDQITQKIKKQIEAYEDLAIQIENIQKEQLKLQNNPNLDIGIKFEEAKTHAQTYINKIREINETGLLDQHQSEVQELEQLFDNLSNNEELTFEQFKKFFDKLKELFEQSAIELESSLNGVLQEWNSGEITKALEKASTQVKKSNAQLEKETDKTIRAFNIESFARIVGSISSISVGIQQVQNLGSIWKNQDLTAGQKMLQTVTNLGFSLPMLTTGISKVSTALTGLFTGLSLTSAGLIVGAITAAITAISFYIKKQEQERKQAIENSKAALEQSKAIQQQIESQRDLYKSLEDLSQEYKQHQLAREELKSKIEELITQYNLEGQAAERLRKNYNDLQEAIVAARRESATEGKTAALNAKGQAQNLISQNAEKNGFFDEASGDYFIDFSGGFTLKDEPQQVIDALKSIEGIENVLINTNGKIAQSFKFNIGDSTEDLISFYNKLKQILTDLQANADTPLEKRELNQSQFYNSIKDWVDGMSESIEQYNAQIQNYEKYATQLAALEIPEIRQESIQNVYDYISAREKLRESLEAELQKQNISYDEQKLSQMTDAQLAKNYQGLFIQFDDAADQFQKLKERFGEIPDSVKKAFDSLTEDRQAALINLLELSPSIISNWEQLEKIIDDIANKNLSNVDKITSIQELRGIQANAADKYNIYQSLQDQVEGGKTISKKQLESLEPEVQSFFKMMANGQYKMVGDAKQFYELVNSLKLDGFKESVSAINNQLNRIENFDSSKLQGYNYNQLAENAAQQRTVSVPGVSGGATYTDVDLDLVTKQVDYLKEVTSESDWETQQLINHWSQLIESKNITALGEQCQNIANAISKAGDYTGDLSEKSKLLKEMYMQAAHQLHDAMFPTDEDVDTGALESLSETIQQIADQTEGLANSLAQGSEQATRTAEDVAESILRFDDAITDVVDHYDEWLNALNSGSIQEQAEVIQALRDAYADLLDLDGTSLSDDFLTNAENLQLMKAAAEGSEKAYNSLMQAAQQDIATQIGLDTTQFDAGFDHLMDLYYQGQDLDDMEIGASLNNQGFLDGLTEMVRAAGMTAQQATDYLASMGVDAEVIQQNNQAEEQSEALEYKTTLTPNTQTVTNTVLSDSGGMLTPVEVQQSVTSWDQNVEATPVLGTAIKQNKSFALKVISAHKSSGGGFKFSQAANGGGSKGATRRAGSGKKKGGGGGKKGGGSKKAAQPDTSKKDLKKEKEDQRDIYHDINIELDQINRELERVQEQQDRLYGKDLLDNLNKQTAILQQHKQVLEEKHELQEQDLKSQRETLENLGVTFDEYGNISNYLGILAQKQAEINARTKDYNSLIEAYNESTNKDMKKNIADEAEAINKQIKAAEDDYKQLEKKIKDYDGLREDMEDLVDQIEKETQKQIELNIKKFRTEIEIRLDMGEAERDWDQFRRDVLEHTDVIKDTDFQEIFSDALQKTRDATSYFDVNGSMGSLQMLTNQLMDTRAEIEAINETGKSAIYGDNKAQAMEDLQNDLNKLMDQMADVQKLIDDIDKAYLNTIDDIEDQFDKQIEDYEYIGELIQHDIDLLNLLYGEKNYDAMDRYFATLERNNLKQIDSLKQQRDFWREQWDAAVARGDTQAAKQFEQNYKETIKNLNSVIQDAAKNLQDRYINAIDKIFDELDKKISNGYGTDYLSTEWQLMNQNADEYLDTINAAFAVQQTQRKYRDALNDTQSIKNQQALRNLMNEQLDILKNKEKITQYDIDRAEKLLQVEQARIALEDAQSAKTSLRLKRDSQGNYSYEYAADNGAIDDARANLANAQNDLYNFDKERYQSNLDDMLSAWKDFQSEYKDIITDSALTEQQRIEKLALLREQYGQYINDKTAENLVVRNNLMESAFADLAALYNTDVDNYNQMSTDEQNILMGDLVPAWESGIQQMADKVAGEGGFIPTCEEAFESIEEQTKSYQDSLQELADAAGMNLEDIQNGVDDLAYEFENLIEKNDDLIIRMNDQMLAIESLRNLAQALVNDYNNVYQAAAEAVTQLHQFVQAEQAAAAAYQETARAYESMINRIQRANAAYAANPYGNYPVGNSSNGDSSSGNSGGGSGSSGGSRGGSSNSGGGSRYKNVTTSIYDGSGRTVSWKNKISYSTGGYTGNWNSDEGRPAILHQKEIVLNQDDTKNFLNGIKILRQMTASLGGTLANRMSDIGINFGNSNNKDDEINQNVHIEASFPNVDSKREIEEALNDLVNIAAQRALKI